MSSNQEDQIITSNDPNIAEAQINLLSPKEQQVIDDFAQKIDLTNSNIVLQYGTALQKKIAGFSETALENVRTKDLGETGGMIADLIATLKGFSTEEEKPKGLMGLFKKGQNRIETLKTGYNKAEQNVENIATMLEQHQLLLLKDISTLDKLYDMNLSYFKELSMYILAGKKKLMQERETTLMALLDKAKLSNLPEDAQSANDFGNLCDRFEKKISDLELTRMVSIQMAPQIRLLQNNNTLMAEKIQSTIVNTIPLWKSQMVLALGLAHSQQAMQAQRAVSDMTNELLRRNAEMLKAGTLETAREAERGIVDLETLQNTNTMLISTLDEVQQIQAQGREKRRAIEAELFGLESQLKQKLLDLKG